MDREAGIVDEIEQYLEAAYEDSRLKVVVAGTVVEIVGKAVEDAVASCSKNAFGQWSPRCES